MPLKPPQAIVQMNTIGKNVLLFSLFLIADGLLSHLRMQNLGLEPPWRHIALSWLVLAIFARLLQEGLHRLKTTDTMHWSVIALAIVAGCAAGQTYLSTQFGAWVGAVACVLMVGLLPTLNHWMAVAPLFILWVFATPQGQSLGANTPTEPLPDIVVITIDTVREDAISHSPNALIPALTPQIDALAQSGCWTQDASATSPLTGPSHAAIFSGVHPLELGLFRNGGQLPNDIPWLPEELHRLGYQTGAFVSSAMIEGDLGYRRGFDVYDDDQSGLAAELGISLAPLLPAPRISKHDAFSRFGLNTVARMGTWLQRTDPNRPVFLWLHLYDAHQPYVATAESQRFVADIDINLPAPQSFTQWTEPKFEVQEPTIAQTIFADLRPKNLPQLDDATAIGMSKRYLANIRDLDGIVGAAWDTILEHRDPHKRVWAVLSDHGESLTEHGELGSHQHNVYEANIRVPYILSGTDCPTGPVSTVGLSAELIKRAQLKIPWTVHETVESVVSAGKAAPSHPSTIKASKRDGTHKIVAGFQDGDTVFMESYDLSTDRHERTTVESQPAQWTSFLQDIRLRIDDAPHARVEDETVNEALRALGYIE